MDTQKQYARLNPCFNGRCTRTNATNSQEVKEQVVLILVLMEDALVQPILITLEQNENSLNPCFNGRCTRTLCCSR